MNQDERIIAEKALQQFGNSIEIKDYGMALAIMHRQIQYAQSQVKNVSSNSMLADELLRIHAVKFAEYCNLNYGWDNDSEDIAIWTDDGGNTYTTEEMYAEYKEVNKQ